MASPKKNIEIKARCSDLASIRCAAEHLGAQDAGQIQQRDTFFAAPHARLKLREFGDGRGELISYVRPDSAAARFSEYVRAPTRDPATLRLALQHALGIVGCVVKARRLLLLRATRIHLDDVEGLGSFVELETVLTHQTEEEARDELSFIANALGLQERDFVGLPYVDLLTSGPALPG